MKWHEVKIIFESQDQGQASYLIADIFYEIGLKGLVFEEPPNDNHYAIIGYIPENKDLNKKIDEIKYCIKELENNHKIFSKINCKIIEDQDWAESWKEYFYPERIGKNIVVKPTWREFVPDKNDIIIELDPGMAFGTGNHPTTAMCIKLIEKYMKSDMSFLDIGTGSGILMITAAKLGAKKLVGIDIDEMVVDIAQKNLIQNKIKESNFNLICGDLIDNINEKFDIVVSNILSEVIIVLLDNINEILSENALFICSGIVENNKDLVIDKMKMMGFTIVEAIIEDKWAAIVGFLKRFHDVSSD